MSLVETIHGGYVHSRRVRVLCEHLAEMLPREAAVLDVGCGDGLLSRLLLDKRADLSIQGIDVLVRPGAHIPVKGFDGLHLPFADGSFDVAMFVDVLHHAEDAMGLLREAKRVARGAIVIKDHAREGLLANATLRFMDWVGNARHGVALRYDYWTKQKWLAAFEELELRVIEWKKDLGLYPFPASLLFGRSLHFLARVEPKAR